MSSFVLPDRTKKSAASTAEDVTPIPNEFDSGSGMPLPPTSPPDDVAYHHAGVKEESPRAPRHDLGELPQQAGYTQPDGSQMNRTQPAAHPTGTRIPPWEIDLQRTHRIRTLVLNLRHIMEQERALYYDDASSPRNEIIQWRRRVERELVIDVTDRALTNGTMDLQVVQAWRGAYEPLEQARREARGERIAVLALLEPFF